MKLTAASDTNRPSTCLHYQQPSERTLTKRAGLQATSAVDFRKNSQKFAHFRATKTKTRHGVHKSDFTSENARKKGLQTNLTSNNHRYTPEREASSHTLSVEPPKEQHLFRSHRRLEGTTSMARLSTTSKTSVYMKQNVLKSFPGVA